MTSVSVHIVTYNSKDVIAQCIQSVFQQTFPVKQIIVIDNHSSDETVQILSQFRSKLEIVRNAENVGFAAAHNQAIQMSACDYYLILNPDVILHPDYVRVLVNYLERDPRCGSATGKLIRAQDPDQIDSTGLWMNKTRRATDRGMNTSADQFHEMSEVFGVSGAAALYSKQMVQEISIEGDFFDEDFFAYKEDVDVAWRARLMGWRAYYIPEATAIHERGWKEGARKQQPINIRRHSYINRYYMMLKNERFLYVIKHAYVLLPFEILSLIYVIFREPRLCYSWVNFWRLFSKMVRKRKMIQAKYKERPDSVYKFFT